MERFVTCSIVALTALQLFLNADAAVAGLVQPPPQVPGPTTLALLSAGAGLFAAGVWWRNRRK